MKYIKIYEEFSPEGSSAEDKGPGLDTQPVPKGPTAGTYLLFNGNKLSWMEDGKEVKSWAAVSGRSPYQFYIKPSTWTKRQKLSHPEWSKSKNEGPTPEGDYTLGPEQYMAGDTWKNKESALLAISKTTAGDQDPEFAKKYPDPPHEFSNRTNLARVAWGNYRYALIPSAGTQTHGRGSFYLHGGSFPGSIGCIDLTVNSGDFADYYKKWREKTKKKTIKLKVDYSDFNKDADLDQPKQPFKFSKKEAQKDPDTWREEMKKTVKDTLTKNKLPVPKYFE